MAGEIVLKSGALAPPDRVREYFAYLFDAEERGDEFPVDLDAVWMMAYTTKFNAKRALIEDEQFYEGEDYLLLRNEEQSKVNVAGHGGGLNRERIQLSLGCFEFFVARKSRPVFEIYRQCRIAATQAARKAAQRRVELPYHLRRYLANHDQVPFGYFSILQEMTTKLIAPMELSGYTLPDNMVPDISLGKIFCNYLRAETGVDPDSLPTYSHKYEDGRTVRAKLYPINLLPDFIKLFQEDWLSRRAERYFRDRDESALPHIPKKLNPPSAEA